MMQRPARIDRTLERMAQEHVHPDIIGRVRRLNVDTADGQMLRGIHYKMDRHQALWQREMRKGEFIRSYGADAWRNLPRESIRKRGRREAVALEAVADELWLLGRS